MFSTSSHIRRWFYSSEDEVQQLRAEANQFGVQQFNQRNLDAEVSKRVIVEPLTADEERLVVEQYADILLQFCSKFQPVLPPSTVATSMAYLQRFYLNHSVMEFYPREIMLTCLYLAAKVDEFVISFDQFCSRIPRKPDFYGRIVINSELFLIDALKYDLVVHTPYRPLDGHCLDLAALGVCPSRDMMLVNQQAHSFLHRSLLTDAALLHPPAQISLAALAEALHCIDKELDSEEGGCGFRAYVRQLCSRGAAAADADAAEDVEMEKRMSGVLRRTDAIRELVNSERRSPDPQRLEEVEARLQEVRNPAHDPVSEIFKYNERQYQKSSQSLLDEEAGAPSSPGRPDDVTALNIQAIRDEESLPGFESRLRP